MWTRIYNKLVSNPITAPIVLVIISIISHLEWFNPKSTLFYHDWQHRTNEAVSQITNFSRGTWLSYTELGSANIQINTFFNTYIWGLIGDYDIAFKVSHLLPIAILSVLSPYFLTLYLTRSKYISFIGALLYGFNTYILLRSTSHLPIAFVFSLTPIIILFFIKMINETSWKGALYFSLVFSLGCYYEIRIMYIVSIILLLYFFVCGDLSKHWKNRNKYLVSATIIILLNMFWIIPSLVLDRSSFTEVMNRGLWGDNLFSISYALAFFDSRWTGGILDQNFIAQPITLRSWLVPVLATFSFLQFRKESFINQRLIVFFTIVLVIGLLLVKQSDGPFPDLYQWLYLHLPGFSLFREASKFYLLIAVGYLGLVIFGLRFLASKLIYFKRLRTTLFVLLSVILLFNIGPFVTKNVGALFVNRHKPSDYQKLDSLISKDKAFYRTLWVPLTSKWAYYDTNHPKVSAWELFTDQRSDYSGENGLNSFSNTPSTLSNFENPKLYSNILNTEYGKDILSKLGIRYIVIPLELPETEDRIFPYAGNRADYIAEFDKITSIQKVNLGANSLVVYENKDYLPRIDTSEKLYTIDKNTNPILAGNFLNDIGEDRADLLFNGAGIDGVGYVNSLFNKPRIEKTSDQGTMVWDEFESDETTLLYQNQQKQDLYYEMEPDVLKIYSKNQKRPLLESEVNRNEQDGSTETIASMPLKNDANHYIKFGDMVHPILADTTKRIGTIPVDDNISIITTSKANLIHNGDFEQGGWDSNVKDCNRYDENPLIGMDILALGGNGKSLRLDSTRHTACTSTEINVTPDSNLLFGFNYRGLNASYAGYYISFDDNKRTQVTRKLVINSDDWKNYYSELSVPADATTATLYFYSYETDGQQQGTVIYDDATLSIIQDSLPIQPPMVSNAGFIPVPLESGKVKQRIAVENDPENQNLVPNPGFEYGAWDKNVGDCWNYNNAGMVYQSLVEHNNPDDKALSLTATKHNGCNSTTLNIPISGDYLLNFAYQSPTISEIGYYLSFDNSPSTIYKNRFNTKDTDWHQYSELVHAPSGATTAKLYIYSYESDGSKTNIANYDDFKFIKSPELIDGYYTVDKDALNLTRPGQIEHIEINPTKYSSKISEANDPFILTFGESFSPGWKIYLSPLTSGFDCVTASLHDNNKECMSGNKSNILDDYRYVSLNPLLGSQHLKLNNLINGWYIDPTSIKRNYDSSFWEMNDDGSINFNLVIYYQPQSYFYVGLFVSSLTAVSIIGFTSWYAIKYRRKTASYSIRR